MKAIGQYCRKIPEPTICLSSNNPCHPRKSVTIAARASPSIVSSLRRSGATLKDTNSIMHNDAELPESDMELNGALEAALSKKALDLVVLDVSEVCSFTDNFVICTGTSNRHNQTIADGIEERLRGMGVRTLHIEGRT